MIVKLAYHAEIYTNNTTDSSFLVYLFVCLFVCLFVFSLLHQNMYGWPDEPFEEMDSTLAVQQVIPSEQLISPCVYYIRFIQIQHANHSRLGSCLHYTVFVKANPE